MRVCSPLPGYSLEQLQASISNPFHPPRLGSDDPHQGVDFAVQQNGIALPGETVQVVLDGLVATVVNDRFPYGNAIIVETPLKDIPREWIEKIQAPAPIPTLSPHPSLTCPNVQPAEPWNLDQRSLYLLYAHMLEPAIVQSEEVVECKSRLAGLGRVGMPRRITPGSRWGRQARGSPAWRIMAHASHEMTMCAWR
jgi:murein DD-endopeptidase MepM/ murein hydrolase activator NlpD